MSFVLGLNCKMYYDTDGVDGTTWTEATNVMDVTVNPSKDTDEVTTRGSGGWKQVIETLKDGTIDFSMVWDTDDAFFTAIKNSFFNSTAIGVMALDGEKTTDGSQGLKADFAVVNFTRNEPLGEAVKVDVSLKPRYNITTPPSWYTVSGS